MFGVCWNIVSAVSFGKRVETYKTKGRVKNFQYIDSFSVLTVDDKQSAHLKSQLVQPRDTFQDIQLMLIPQIDEYTRDRIINNIQNKLEKYDEFTSYTLSDGTGVIRTTISCDQIQEISKDSAVCKVELTRFFEVFNSSISPTRRIVEIKPLPLLLRIWARSTLLRYISKSKAIK